MWKEQQANAKEMELNMCLELMAERLELRVAKAAGDVN
jgi:hypothetical protein